MHEPRKRLHTPRRLSILFVLAVAMIGALAVPAFAQSDRDSDGPRVVITGRVAVGARERTDSVVIFDGPAVIDGDVHGSVVAFHGDVLVRGHVDSNVVAVRGRAAIASSATVGGDVVSSERPLVARGARIDGDIRRENFRNYFRALGWALWFGWWLAVSISLFVLGVVLLAIAPRMFPPILDVARTRVGPVIGWGLIIAIGLPIVSVLVMVTLVGFPLGLIGLLSLALLYSVGYVIAALLLGRRLLAEPRNVILAFLVGLLILRVVGLIPVLGGLVTAAATIYGVGALAIAAWRAARRPAPRTPQAAEEPTPAPAN